MIMANHGNCLWFYLTAIAGSVAFLATCWLIPTGGRVSRFLGAGRAVRFVGSNTLIYLGMAGLALHFLDDPVLRNLPWQPRSGLESFLVAAIYSLAVMTFFAPWVWAVRRWLPLAVGFGAGSRRKSLPQPAVAEAVGGS